MNFFRLRLLSLSLVSLAATTAYAVDQLPEKEEDIPVEIIPRHDYTLSIGLHQLTKGPTVKFGNLGVYQPRVTLGTDSNGATTRTYSNGSITRDYPYGAETLSDGSSVLQANGTINRSTYIATATPVMIKSSDGTMVSNGQTVVTVYTPVSVAKTITTPNGDGTSTTTPVQNSDGTYTAVTTPVFTVNPVDGSTTVSDAVATTWASTSQFLGYKDGQLRTWSVQNASQIDMTNRTVSMSSYGTSGMTDGGTIDVNSNGSKGFELSLERKLGQQGRLEWGVSGGFKFVDLNAKLTKTINSNLVRSTTVFKMVDTGLNFVSPTATVSISQPSNVVLTLLDPSGKQVYEYAGSSTAPYTTTLATDTSTGDTSGSTPLYFPDSGDNMAVTNPIPEIIGVARVHGFWQLKGAYYFAHFGPDFRYRFNDSWAVSGNFGFALAYIGTNFRVDESFDDVNDVFDLAGNPITTMAADSSNPKTYASTEKNSTHKIIPGLYGEVNVEYWMTERTGFYFGVSQQTLRNYKQNPLSGRTANIDLGSSSGWRIGIITKF